MADPRLVHVEASAVRAVRRHLLAEREIPREAVSISGWASSSASSASRPRR